MVWYFLHFPHIIICSVMCPLILCNCCSVYYTFAESKASRHINEDEGLSTFKSDRSTVKFINLMILVVNLREPLKDAYSLGITCILIPKYSRNLVSFYFYFSPRIILFTVFLSHGTLHGKLSLLALCENIFIPICWLCGSSLDTGKRKLC